MGHKGVKGYTRVYMVFKGIHGARGAPWVSKFGINPLSRKIWL